MEQSSATQTEVDKRVDGLCDQMDKRELAEAYVHFYDLWLAVPEEVKQIVENYGSVVAVMLRNYKRELGILHRAHFQPKEYHLIQTAAEYDPVTRERMRENRLRKLQAAVVQALDFVESTEPIEEEEEPITT